MADEVQEFIRYQCTLPTLAKNESCNNCAACGWEMSEQTRRHEYITLYGLTRYPDGSRRLVITRRQNDTENNA